MARVEGCNDRFTYSGFDAAGEAMVLRAGLRWSEFTGAPVLLEPGPSSPRCHIAPGEIADIGDRQVAGLHEYPSHLITLRPDGPDLEVTLLHELGHAYRLGHREDGVIMHPILQPGGDFNEADRAECERVGACVASEDAPR